MPSSFSHAVAGLGAASPFVPANETRRYWICAAVCAAIPDVDWLWSVGRLPYDHWPSHRGLTHSLIFAVALGAAVTWTVLRPVIARADRWRAWIGLSLATASHGFFDGLAAYGAGVAFFLPFTTRRFTFPWHPLSPGSAGQYANVWLKLLAVVGREVLVLWVPSIILFLAFRHIRRRRNGMRLSVVAIFILFAPGSAHAQSSSSPVWVDSVAAATFRFGAAGMPHDVVRVMLRDSTRIVEITARGEDVKKFGDSAATLLARPMTRGERRRTVSVRTSRMSLSAARTEAGDSVDFTITGDRRLTIHPSLDDTRRILGILRGASFWAIEEGHGPSTRLPRPIVSSRRGLPPDTCGSNAVQLHDAALTMGASTGHSPVDSSEASARYSARPQQVFVAS